MGPPWRCVWLAQRLSAEGFVMAMGWVATHPTVVRDPLTGYAPITSLILRVRSTHCGGPGAALIYSNRTAIHFTLFLRTHFSSADQSR